MVLSEEWCCIIRQMDDDASSFSSYHYIFLFSFTLHTLLRQCAFRTFKFQFLVGFSIWLSWVETNVLQLQTHFLWSVFVVTFRLVLLSVAVGGSPLFALFILGGFSFICRLLLLLLPLQTMWRELVDCYESLWYRQFFLKTRISDNLAI